jgi:hypothetical protein
MARAGRPTSPLMLTDEVILHAERAGRRLQQFTKTGW